MYFFKNILFFLSLFIYLFIYSYLFNFFLIRKKREAFSIYLFPKQLTIELGRVYLNQLINITECGVGVGHSALLFAAGVVVGCSKRGEYLGGGGGISLSLSISLSISLSLPSGESSEGNLSVLVPIHGLDFFFY